VRVVLPTSVLLSALISPSGPPAKIYEAWRLHRFELITSSDQLTELWQVTRYPTVRPLITVSEAGRMINQLRALAIVLARLPRVTGSPDPADDFLLAMSQSAKADYLVTGDKSGLLALKKHGQTQIVTAAAFARLID
jgi:hypothetical protein